MAAENLFYPLLAKRQAAVEKKTVDSPIRQKLLLTLPNIRQRFLGDKKAVLTARVNSVDNFVLYWRKVIVNEMMQGIIDDLCNTPTLDADAKWWDSGFPKRENTSCWTPEHLEIDKLAREMAISIYYEIKGRRTEKHETCM